MRFIAATLLCVALSLTAAGMDLLPGVIDTVGGTTFDNQNTGPSLQMVAQDPSYGIHAAWTFSAQPQGSTWPDRTMRYNFYDVSTGAWNWIETGYMDSGLNSQTRRTGYGTLEASPTDGAALVACHYNAGGMPPTFTTTVTRDLAPGVGIFDECVGAPNLTGQFLPVIGLTADETVHLMLIKFQASENLFYGRSNSWCTWEEPANWQVTGAFGHNIITSHRSNKVLATWMNGRNDSLALYYRFSSDAGETWENTQTLTPPTAWGPDTAAVLARGCAGLFDATDNWLLVTTVLPAVGDTAYSNPAQIWMYNSGTAEWSRVRRAESHALAGGFGSHAAICDRPSLGLNEAAGKYYVAWEEFDSSNVEPSTNLLRADIFVAWSDDGTNWSEPAAITTPDESSKRLPNLAKNCSGDSLAIVYMQDLIAGFNVDEVGAASDNPICVWRGSGVGIAEREETRVRRFAAFPNPGVRFAFSLGGPAEVDIFDVEGRLVRTLATQTGHCLWNATDNNGLALRAGCYLARWRTATESGEDKLVVLGR